MEGISGREFSLCPSLKIRNIQNSHVPRKVSLVNLTNNSSRGGSRIFRTSVKKKSDRAWSAQGVVDAEGG